jgi:peptide/nickel transport system substrate-binding protein
LPKLDALRESWFDAPDLPPQQAIATDIKRVVFEEAPDPATGQYFHPTAYRRSITARSPRSSPSGK